jgi:hypothetical protein
MRHYLVEGAVYLLICWPSFFGLGNQDGNPHPGRFRPDVATTTRGRVSLLEGIAAEEIDLVVGINFISCNGSPVVIYVMYSSY